MPPPLARTPLTPKLKPRISGSPSNPSLPFDWDAALNHRPPPFAATPASQRKLRKSIGTSTPTLATPDSVARKSTGFNLKRVYRKVPVKERIINWASQLIYDIQDFPADHLPDLQKVARVFGGALHFIHFIVCYSRNRQLRDEDVGWHDMLGEITINEGLDTDSWINWTTLAAAALLAISIANTIYLLTRNKSYLLFHKHELSTTPSAEFIDRNDLNLAGDVAPPSLSTRLMIQSLHIIRIFWNFLLGREYVTPSSNQTRKVQRLNVWSPDQGEMELFIIYSPLHALLWQAVSPGNWIIIFILMAIASLQLFIFKQYYSRLVKDKEIIAAEVLHEYDKKFVYPRIMRLRRDACVMTNEAETISFYR